MGCSFLIVIIFVAIQGKWELIVSLKNKNTIQHNPRKASHTQMQILINQVNLRRQYQNTAQHPKIGENATKPFVEVAHDISFLWAFIATVGGVSSLFWNVSLLRSSQLNC